MIKILLKVNNGIKKIPISKKGQGLTTIPVNSTTEEQRSNSNFNPKCNCEVGVCVLLEGRNTVFI